MVRTKTSPQKTFNSKGFTLIEVMIVVAIIALLLGLALPSISSRNQKMKGAVRKLSVVSRQVFGLARLKNVTFRLAINMRTGSDSEEAHMYWVEQSKKPVLLGTAEEREAEAEQVKQSLEEAGEYTPPSGWEIATKVMKKPTILPFGMVFKDIELAREESPLDSGIVYIHFFPQGAAEEAAIHIEFGENLKWTLATQKLTGKVDIITRRVELKELQRR